jgi:NAD(P)-dependent dehydrogenase (short-subunit alcohol dehydrogenase family)
MNAQFDVKNRTALVTGANRGIGKAIVAALLDNGVGKVYAAVRDLESAAPLRKAYGDKVIPVRMDLNEPETITSAAAKAPDVEIVVNNAGILSVTSPLDENAIASLGQEMEVNVYGLIRVAQAFAPILKKNGGGVFVQLNSVASIKCFSTYTTYSASKAAAYSITQALHERFAEQGTTVLSVHPGPIATDMGDAAGFSEIAAPASVVADSIVEGMQTGAFHIFPDAMAKMMGGAYQSYAESIVEVDLFAE